MAEMEQWRRTREAADMLGIAESTLRRRLDRVGGPLQYGAHWYYRTGNVQGGCLFNVSAIREVLKAEGRR